MSENRAVGYKGPGVVEVIDIDYPTFELKDGPGVNPANVGRKVPHGVIVKTVTTNICGSDQHMVRGRTTAPVNLVLGQLPALCTEAFHLLAQCLPWVLLVGDEYPRPQVFRNRGPG